MIDGSLANARAIATRCCSPPESCEGLMPAPTGLRFHQIWARSRASRAPAISIATKIFERRCSKGLDEKTKHETDLGAANFRELVFTHSSDHLAIDVNLA